MDEKKTTASSKSKKSRSGKEPVCEHLSFAAKEAFKFYCAMISKVTEFEIIDRKQAKRRITKFYNECGLE